jgi:hypothetical protein
MNPLADVDLLRRVHAIGRSLSGDADFSPALEPGRRALQEYAERPLTGGGLPAPMHTVPVGAAAQCLCLASAASRAICDSVICSFALRSARFSLIDLADFWEW